MRGGFRRIVFIIWSFHTLSASVGVLQVYFPGRFQPHVSDVLIQTDSVSHFLITLANGETILRPMGLSDVPGGAAISGFYALLFSLGLFWDSRRLIARMILAGSMVIGLFCIYVSHVRSTLVMAAICLIVFFAVLAWRFPWRKLFALCLVMAGIIGGSLTWAVSVGGDSLIRRLESLVEAGPAEVYYENRGLFLEYTVNTLLPQYPLGAGLGRWGMMYYYFGDKGDAARGPLYAEIQWTAWLFDGGVPLIVMYSVAIALACFIALWIAWSRLPTDLRLWGALLFAYNIGALAVTFNYPWFMGQGGMEFWFLNAALFGAACSAPLRVAAKQRP